MHGSDSDLGKLIQRGYEDMDRQLGLLIEESVKKDPSQKERPVIKFAFFLKNELMINLGAAASLAANLFELQKICNSHSNLFESEAVQERIIELGRFIKIDGRFEGLDYAVDKLPGCDREDLKELWADIAKWENKPRRSDFSRLQNPHP